MAEPESAAEMRSELLRSVSAIRSLRVTYQVSQFGPRAPEGAYFIRTVAAKYPNLFFHRSAHGSKTFPWTDDPYQQNAYVNDTGLIVEFPNSRFFFESPLSPTAALTGSLPDEQFLLCSGIWPTLLREPPRPLNRPHMLCDVAGNEDYNVLNQEMESRNGVSCYVLKNSDGSDRLWLAKDRGLALVGREIDMNGDGMPDCRYEITDLRQFSENTWLPFELRIIEHDWHAKRSDLQRRVVVDILLKVNSASLNDVPDESFAFAPSPGMVKREGESYSQVTAGGMNHLDEAATLISRHFPPSITNGDGSSKWTYFIWLSLAFSGFMCVAQTLRSKIRPRMRHQLP